MKKPDHDPDSRPGISPRLLRTRPAPTEFQMFGGVVGVVLVGLAIIGILYALLQSLR